ncbi:competence protein ComEC [Pedobacter africanus]|uniref:Competence protein ComEC n=1 Tax=Pedobacter africanus TaxID=151894 RepID=A0ACC6KQW0_9SPHI|nr:ComEC/Rec2 family competence protein [Pedobacter africanus]MDR6781704.1 competence protein ComEC [Pedobacter africanus]
MTLVYQNPIKGLPFIRILLPFSLGIVSTYQVKLPYLSEVLSGLNAGLLLLLFSLAFQKERFASHQYIRKAGLLLHCFFYLSGCLSSTLYNHKLNTDYYAFKNLKYLKLKIIDEPKIKPNNIWFEGMVTNGYHFLGSSCPVISERVSGKIRVAVRPDSLVSISLEYGDELLIPVAVMATDAPGSPAEFDVKSWLASRNIYHQTFLKQTDLVKLNSNNGHSLIRYALKLREKQVAFYRKIIKNEEAFALVATLILGYRSDLSTETLNIYSKTGTIHALSVSGMHVGLIYLVLNWMLFFLNGSRTLKYIKTLLILILIWAYSLLTGFSPSILRSAIMLSVFIIARLFDKRANSYNVIAFAAFCLLLYNPFLIWDIGFQLSFLAVLGLMYLQPDIYAWLAFKNPLLDKIWAATTMSAAAQLTTYPLSIYYFHQFPLCFLISNLFIMIPVTLILYIGIITLLFKIECLGPLLEALIRFTNTGLNKIAELPFSGISGIWISKTELLLLCVTIICFVMAMQHYQKRLLFVSLLAFLSFQCFGGYHKLKATQQKKIIRFKLKHNYAIACISAHSAVLYTDLDPGSKPFKYVIKPVLDQHQIERVIFLYLAGST